MAERPIYTSERTVSPFRFIPATEFFHSDRPFIPVGLSEPGLLEPDPDSVSYSVYSAINTKARHNEPEWPNQDVGIAEDGVVAVFDAPPPRDMSLQHGVWHHTPTIAAHATLAFAAASYSEHVGRKEFDPYKLGEDLLRDVRETDKVLRLEQTANPFLPPSLAFAGMRMYELTADDGSRRLVGAFAYAGDADITIATRDRQLIALSTYGSEHSVGGSNFLGEYIERPTFRVGVVKLNPGDIVAACTDGVFDNRGTTDSPERAFCVVSSVNPETAYEEKKALWSAHNIGRNGRGMDDYTIATARIGEDYASWETRQGLLLPLNRIRTPRR